MQARTVVMAEVVAFIHEVQLIKQRHGIRKKILGTFRIVESMLHPSSDRRDGVHA